MRKQVFINLPVVDLLRAITFYEKLGFARNPDFEGEDAGCISICDSLSIMLCPQARFREFTPKAICDTSVAVEMLLNLSCDSREEVDGLVAKALAAGGSTYDKPEDFGFMYTHSFVDPDGHGWGLFHMTAEPSQS